MKASELVAQLQELIAEHGDVPVVLFDGHDGSHYALDQSVLEVRAVEVRRGWTEYQRTTALVVG